MYLPKKYIDRVTAWCVMHHLFRHFTLFLTATIRIYTYFFKLNKLFKMSNINCGLYGVYQCITAQWRWFMFVYVKFKSCVVVIHHFWLQFIELNPKVQCPSIQNDSGFCCDNRNLSIACWQWHVKILLSFWRILIKLNKTLPV